MRTLLSTAAPLVLAGAYTFHDGVLGVDEDHGNGRHVHVWVPAAVVPAAMHFVPKERMEEVTVQVSPWLPTLRAVTKELRKYPEAEFVNVSDADASQRTLRTSHPTAGSATATSIGFTRDVIGTTDRAAAKADRD